MKDWQDSLSLLIKLSIWTISLVLFYFALNYVLPLTNEILGRLTIYLFPFIIGTAIAVLIDPVVEFLTKNTRFSRGWSTLISLFFTISIISFALFFITSRLVVELLKIAANLPSPQKISDFFTSWLDAAEPYYALLYSSPEVVSTLQRVTSDGLVTVKNMMVSLSNFLLETLAALPEFFTVLLFTIIATFFISRDKRLVLGLIYGILPRNRAKQARQVIIEMGRAFIGFIRAQFILITITGILTIIGLYIIGIEYAFTIGVLAGMLDILPIVGPGLLFIPWIGWELLTGNYGLGAKLALLYGFIAITRQMIEPKVVADSIGLHPLITLLAIYVGLRAFGFIGIIIGPAVVLLLLSFYRAGIFREMQTR
ncbi:sporulation integral membrane protein YtvI [Heliorestis acidaminivorans]|uniref:Sporulation integral membrane protein YtvI n=1 Tax=Heliorestis acidaminivorans TaxID=553427 RepID=A0A6I0EUA2_9FIRM|nr:sporulation integral membrane protein YtvI [Heliorestis acidaminivorans]KAB2954365.1 sporulation integral membrane protein YtvI [Heliorestis acidaminivorans]